jgi:hypothetical protein
MPLAKGYTPLQNWANRLTHARWFNLCTSMPICCTVMAGTTCLRFVPLGFTFVLLAIARMKGESYERNVYSTERSPPPNGLPKNQRPLP